jgi:hypothetical protein
VIIDSHNALIKNGSSINFSKILDPEKWILDNEREKSYQDLKELSA